MDQEEKTKMIRTRAALLHAQPPAAAQLPTVLAAGSPPPPSLRPPAALAAGSMPPSAGQHPMARAGGSMPPSAGQLPAVNVAGAPPPLMGELPAVDAAGLGSPPVAEAPPPPPESSSARSVEGAPGRVRPAHAPALIRAGRRARLLGALAAGGLALGGVGGVALWMLPQRAPVSATPAPPTPGPGPERVEPPRPVGTQTPPAVDLDATAKRSQATVRAGLKHDDPAVRAQSATLSGWIGDPASASLLAKVAEHDRADEVRGGAALALGMLGASSSVPLLEKLERGAAPPLKIWFAAALARLGEPGARRRLLRYIEDARRKDLALAFRATLALADASKPGDRKALRALGKLAARAPELGLPPGESAEVQLLARRAALGAAPARRQLHAHLAAADEGVRFAAAAALAKLGDPAGKPVLQEVLANPKSPHRLAAAVAQISLGEYGELELLTQAIRGGEPAARRLAMRGLGELGDPTSIDPLLAYAGDPDWLLRVAAAAAVAAIVGIEPQVLAQASVDWTKQALDSQDWAVRKAAAGVLADLPEQEAMPLLAAAVADPNEQVRDEAARSAGRMKGSTEAAETLVARVKVESSPKVKEQQLKALGEIGSPAARDTLAEIVREEPGKLGVIAAGSLIAVGDPSGKDRLEAAVRPGQPADLRLAAVEAASTAARQIVIPTLLTGVKDFVFEIRFTAALALAGLKAGQDAAVPVLNDALRSKDAGVVGRAMAALIQLGQQLAGKAPTPAELVGSPDPKQRLAAVPIVRALPVDEGVPLLRRLVADGNQDVRRAGVDAIDAVASRDRAQAIRLYRPLVRDADLVVRAKAQGRLTELAPRPPPTPPPPTTTAPGPQVVDPAVRTAHGAAGAAAAAVKQRAAAFEVLVAELGTRTAARPRGDAALEEIERLATSIAEAAARLGSAATEVEAAAVAAADAAGPQPAADAAKLVAEARALAKDARAAAAAARRKAPEAKQQADGYLRAWTHDARMLLNMARAEMIGGRLAEAEDHLGGAARLLRRSGASLAEIDALYVDLHIRMGDAAQDPAAKRKHLQRAQDAFARLEESGTARQVQEASAQLAELLEEVEQLDGPGAP